MSSRMTRDEPIVSMQVHLCGEINGAIKIHVLWSVCVCMCACTHVHVYAFL